MDERELPPPAQMMNLLFGKAVTQAIAVMAQLGLADYMKDDTRSSDDIARTCGAHAGSVYRLLRALSVVGVVAEKEDKRFALTPVGQCLRADAPGTLRHLAMMVGAEWHTQVWTRLQHSVTTGDGAFRHAYGTGIFEWFGSHRQEAAGFNDAMTSFSTTTAGAVCSSYDFSPFKKIADIGGGHGYLLASILNKAPQATGLVFDAPAVVAGAQETLTKAGVADRSEVVGGDFFEAVPAGCDAYVMKHILHDWDDARSAMILRNCAAGLNPGGKVLVVEGVVAPPGAPSFQKLMDLEMLVMTDGGVERTEAEFASLFASAGLRLSRVVPTPSPVQVIEGVLAH